MTSLPLGKLPPDLLEKILLKAPIFDDRIVLGPGTGIDCAVIDNGKNYLVVKSDPITFTADNIGWYSVQINLNDLATTGAEPRWMISSLLLPEGKTSPQMVEKISNQLFDACRDYQISLIGGHTEITHNIDRPLLISTLIGEVDKTRLISPKGAREGNHLILTKGIPIETVAIIASDFKSRLNGQFSEKEISDAKNYLYNPGISVYKEARLAADHGGVTAMHDPTEGGLAAALWELSIASSKKLRIIPENIYIFPLAQRICDLFNINPLNSISSGAMLMAVESNQSEKIIKLLKQNNINAAVIGEVLDTGEGVCAGDHLIERPLNDDIGKIYG